MIEARTFEGDAATAAEFTVQVWSDRYSSRIPVIHWSQEYFQWQLFWDRPGGRDFLVGAYDGSKLVGTLFAERLQFHLRGEPFVATMGSWLSVHRDYRGKGIARKLADEQRKRHRAHGAQFMMGFGVLGTDGPKFWESLPDTQVNGTVGFWVRVLDERRMVDWALAWRDRFATRLATRVFGAAPQAVAAEDVRRYEPGDLAACLELVHPIERSGDLGYRWTGERLAHQLEGSSPPRTWVFTRHGRAAGFVNYYLVGMTGRSYMPVAVIDLIVLHGLSADERKRLLNNAFADMAALGAGFAMTMRLPCYPWSTFTGLGFAPTPRETSFLFLVVDPNFPLKDLRRFHVTWR